MRSLNSKVVYSKQARALAGPLVLRHWSAKLRHISTSFLLVVALLLIILALPDLKSYSARAVGHAQTRAPGSSEGLIKSFGKLPLTFELNQGQLNGDIRFLSRGAGSEIYLMSDEVVLKLPTLDQELSPTTLISNCGREVSSKFDRVNRRHSASASRDLVSMRLVKALATTPVGLDQSAGTVNYFIGKDPQKWQTHVRTYRGVLYRGVYPGIDQVFHGNEQQLEYDFIVSPGANPRVITLAFGGVRGLRIDQGDLVLRIKGPEEIRFKKPLVYQEVNNVKQQILARYVIRARHHVGFEIGDYDASKPLIIDPVLSYSTYLGGSGNDAGFDVAVDGNGNAYVTGSTDSPEFSTLGGSNAFVAKAA